MLPTVLWIDDATRPGYSLWHHGASQLGLGERAGLQTVNFVLSILVVGFCHRRTSSLAVRTRRELGPDPACGRGHGLERDGRSGRCRHCNIEAQTGFHVNV